MSQNSSIDLNIINLNIDLNRVNYKKTSSETGQFDVNMNQSVSLVEIRENAFIIDVTRKINIEPESIFELEVSILLTFMVSEESLEILHGDEIEEYIKANMNDFVENSPAGSILSLLISQITGSCGNVPLVTPPNLKQN